MNLLLFSLSTVLLSAIGALAELDLAKILSLQQQLPECSVECIQKTAAEHNCTVVDLECQCSNMQPIIQDVTPCFVRAGCGLDDIANSAQTVFKICETVAEAATENSTAPVEPPIPTQTLDDKTDDAAISRLAMPGTLAIAVVVAGLVVA